MSEPTPRPFLAVPRILWLALLASQVIYAALLLVPGWIDRPAAPPDDIVLVALIAAAVGCAVASFVLPQVVRRSAVGRAQVELREVPDTGAPVGFRGAAPTVREYADLAAVSAAARAVGMTPLILSLALSEAVSVLGVVSGLLGQPAIVWGAFVAAGMTLTALRFPTERSFLAPIEQHTGVPIPR